MKWSSSNASFVADWSFSSSATRPRQASDETISVGRKCVRANVDLPEPLAPTRTTSESSGTSSARLVSATLEHPHLRRRADLGVLGPDRQEAGRVPEAPRDLACPVLELAPRPLEAVIAMAKAPRGQPVEANVVLAVRSRHDDRGGARLLEDDPLERGEPRRIEVLDHLDRGGRVEAGQALVAVGQGGLEELDALALSRRELLEPQARMRDLERPVRDVDAEDLLELSLVHELADELAAAAAEVDDPLRTAGAKDREYRAETRLVQAERLLHGLFLDRALLVVAVRIRIFVLEQLRERIARQGATVLEVAVDDQLAIGMTGEPALAAAEQLLDLVVSDPVVLLGVEHRHEHVQMREEVAKPEHALEVDREVAAVAPLGERLVERVVDSVDVVAEWLEEPPQHTFAAGAGKRREMGAQRDRRLRELRPRLRPPGQRGREDAGDRDAEERRRDVRPVVHVLVEARELHAAADEPDRVDVEQQRSRAALVACLGIEDVRLTKGQRERLQTLRALMQQVAQVCGRTVGCRDRQQHRCNV